MPCSLSLLSLYRLLEIMHRLCILCRCAGVAAVTKARDIAYVQRLQSRQWTRLGVKNNTLLQKHFRDDNFGSH